MDNWQSLAGAAALLLCSNCAVANASPCTALLGGTVAGNGTVTLAEDIAAAKDQPGGVYTAPDGSTYPNTPAFCRIAATLKPTPESDINIEVWLPAGSAWNGRFVGTGNGGYAGAMVYSELGSTLSLGFAVANTDMGSAPATTFNGEPLTGQRQKQIDFGYRSTHLMTVAGKEIVQNFYGNPADRSYFTGCSTGGGQAYHEAEQFPDDYDGIVGGGPAENRTNLHVSILWDYAITNVAPKAQMSEPLLQTVTGAVLHACGTQNGGLASDPFLADPRSCHWDPGQLACTATQTTNCLNPDQVQAIRLYYDGPRDPRTGARIYPGAMRGSESGSLFDLAALEGQTFAGVAPPGPLFDGLFFWVFGPNWNWQSFDFDRDVARVDNDLGPIANANSIDLSAFRAHGGKFIGHHGWADQLVPPQDDIDYFLRLAASLQDRSSDARSGIAKAHSFFRLFMAPGQGHCLPTGPGPNTYGGADNPNPPGTDTPNNNVLLALQQWVENGVAPEQIIATKYLNDTPSAGVLMTRPLCVFPKIAHYNGHGSTNDAANFTCIDDGVTANQFAAPQYLRN